VDSWGEVLCADAKNFAGAREKIIEYDAERVHGDATVLLIADSVHCRKRLCVNDMKRGRYIVRNMTSVHILNKVEESIRFLESIKRVSLKEKLGFKRIMW
jgi:hypothetical protein